MGRIVFAIAILLFGGAGWTGSALAADQQMWRYSEPVVVGPHPPLWRYNAPNPPPFAHSARAQAVRDSSACWSECASYCAAALNGCLYEDAQGNCLALTDGCNLYCQRGCRGFTSGPLLPLD